MIRRTKYERAERLKAALAERTAVNDRGATVAELMERCGVDWKGRFECRSPGCPRCRRKNIIRQQRRIQETFKGFENSEMAFITIVLPAVRDVADLHAVLKKGLSDLRNRVRACRRVSKLWNDIAVVGWMEIDAISVEQMPFVAPERRDLLLNLGSFGCDTQGPIWVPTIHAIVYLGHTTLASLAGAIEHQWPLQGQTNVRPFWPDHIFESNIDMLVGYVNKFACSTNLCADVNGGKITDPWPPAWEAHLLHWLHSDHRNAFERLRFSIGQKRDKASVVAVPETGPVESTSGADPMPFTTLCEGSFTSNPMYKYNYENNFSTDACSPYSGQRNWDYHHGP